MLRSTELVNSWSRDGNHELTTCEWNTLLSPAYLRSRAVNSSYTNPTRVHRSWSRVHEFNAT